MEFVSGEAPENIWIAASDGDIAAVEAFLQQGVHVNAQDETGYSPLHAAVSYGHGELIDFLLQRGADLNLRDEDGDTPLLVCEDVATFDKLASYGADMFAHNNHGQGIVEKAVEDENEDLVSHLFQLPGFMNDPKMVEKIQAFVAAMNGEGEGAFLDGIQEDDDEEEEEEEEDQAAMED